MPTIYSYVVPHDIGFAPNPFYGYCTLACCKPNIRKSAQVGDIIVGTTSAQQGQVSRLLYMMEVTEILDFNTYWNCSRFKDKKPNLRGSVKQLYGDNIYHQENGVWQQEDSRHTECDGSPHAKHLTTDTGTTTNVLISKDFVYFGKNSDKIPEDMKWIIQRGRGHKCRFSDCEIESAKGWFSSLPRGVKGLPSEKGSRKFPSGW